MKAADEETDLIYSTVDHTNVFVLDWILLGINVSHDGNHEVQLETHPFCSFVINVGTRVQLHE